MGTQKVARDLRARADSRRTPGRSHARATERAGHLGVQAVGAQCAEQAEQKDQG